MSFSTLWYKDVSLQHLLIFYAHLVQSFYVGDLHLHLHLHLDPHLLLMKETIWWMERETERVQGLFSQRVGSGLFRRQSKFGSSSHLKHEEIFKLIVTLRYLMSIYNRLLF